jgi:hypothetical protein
MSWIGHAIELDGGERMEHGIGAPEDFTLADAGQSLPECMRLCRPNVFR